MPCPWLDIVRKRIDRAFHPGLGGIANSLSFLEKFAAFILLPYDSTVQSTYGGYLLPKQPPITVGIDANRIRMKWRIGFMED